jgi:AraC-like DNA-binding protein
MLPTTSSERELLRQAARERRNTRRLNRRALLTRVASGESRVELAAEMGVSIRSLQRALKRAAAEQPRENRAVHKALQIERLRRALQVTDAKIAAGDLNAVYALTRLLPLLRAYEEFETDKLDYAALYAQG